MPGILPDNVAQAAGVRDEDKEERVRKQTSFFVGVRKRGLLNQMLDGPAAKFEELHPDMRVRWEFAPPTGTPAMASVGDNTFVAAREAMGYRVVDASELGDVTAHQQKSGPVRCGDLVMMAAPREIHEALMQEDAEAAEADLRLPETTYRDHIESLAVQTKSGDVIRGRAIGGVRRSVEHEFVNVNNPRQ